MLGVGVMLLVLAAAYAVMRLRDLGARERSRYARQEEAFLGLLMRLEEGGHRIRDVSFGSASLGRDLSRVYLVPALWTVAVGVVTGLLDPPWALPALAVGVVVGGYGALDEFNLRRRGHGRAEPRRRTVELPLIGLSIAGKMALVAAAAWCALAGVSAINRGALPTGTGLVVLAVLISSTAHLLVVWADRVARRARPGGFAEAATSDSLMLLRSFNDDHLRLRTTAGGIGPTRPALPGTRVRFEEHLALSLLREGPLVAIGRPGERLPELGATRTYWPDSGWQAAVEETATRCRAIVLIAGLTGGLDWEIDLLRRRGLLHKVLIVYPPDPDPERSARRFAHIYEHLGTERLDIDVATDWSPGLFMATGYDEEGRSIHYLSPGRDYASYFATVTYFVGELRGEIQVPPHGAINQSWERGADAFLSSLSLRGTGAAGDPDAWGGEVTMFVPTPDTRVRPHGMPLDKPLDILSRAGVIVLFVRAALLLKSRDETDPVVARRAIRLLRRGRDLARRRGSDGVALTLELEVADAFVDSEQLGEADASFRAVLDAPEAGWTQLAGPPTTGADIRDTALNGLAVLARRRGDGEKFVHYRRLRWENSAGLPSVSAPAEAAGQTADAYRITGRYKEADHWYRLSLDAVAELDGETHLHTQLLQAWALNAYEAGDLETAADRIEQALAAHRSRGVDGPAFVLGIRGDIRRDRGDHLGAVEDYRHATDVARSHNDRWTVRTAERRLEALTGPPQTA